MLLNKLFTISSKKGGSIIKLFNIKIKLHKKHFNLRYLYLKVFKIFNHNSDTTELYLKKYLDKEPIQPKFPINTDSHKVWSMWWQDDMPEIIEMCFDSIKKFYPNLIIITNNNINNYVNIPDFIMQKFDCGSIKLPHFSDYIRLKLLQKYGGTWIDASCYILDSVPDFILKQDFFMFKSIDGLHISNYFIHSSKNNNYFIERLIQCIENYWKDNNYAIDYFFFHIFVNLLIKTDPKCSEIFQNIIPEIAIKTKLLYKFGNAKRPFDIDYWNYLKRTSFLYKINRKNKTAMENPNGFYQYLLNQWRNENLT